MQDSEAVNFPIMALPFPGCVILGKLLNLPKLQIPPLEKWVHTLHRSVAEDKCNHAYYLSNSILLGSGLHTLSLHQGGFMSTVPGVWEALSSQES